VNLLQPDRLRWQVEVFAQQLSVSANHRWIIAAMISKIETGIRSAAVATAAQGYQRMNM